MRLIRAYALFVFLLACLSFQDRAVANEGCLPIEEHVAKVLASPNVKGHIPLTGEKFQRALAYVQKINGDTTPYDSGYIAYSETALVLFVGRHNEICTGYVGAIQYLKALVDAIEGREA